MLTQKAAPDTGAVDKAPSSAPSPARDIIPPQPSSAGAYRRADSSPYRPSYLSDRALSEELDSWAEGDVNGAQVRSPTSLAFERV